MEMEEKKNELTEAALPVQELPADIPDEVRQKLITTGLKSFYSESSAQTKAEAAPLLEELQHMMESGVFLRGGR